MRDDRDSAAAPPSAPYSARVFDALVLGGSAGCTEVMSQLLAALPADFALAVLVVSHLPADTPSYLLETLSYRCALPVIEPDSGEAVVAGRVHIAPPGYHMLVDDDRSIVLSVDASVRFSRPSIDVLFESAAHAFASGLLGILLSGANDDGTHGLEVIRALGGVAWVQDPQTASSATMPRAAIARGAVDDVLSPTLMAQRLAALPAST
ncbi:chemotaxis protein CheB [Paraburkholderia humisilvae]|uniref:protein-glutamate methylesterase n=1 Tax=Paraburkholderia humisilvae TaxID=627669 RepID=A0A6J5DS19_9BURK|nr:chemotaxis protein CheB [Paraburkholderia humisilvae]CAB3755686.1 Protein-glutamate methylesterase/protein-glutamine glutaminase 2 [Paraburkholderia humisilvae]